MISGFAVESQLLEKDDFESLLENINPVVLQKANFEKSLNDNYESVKNTPSDINEHIETFYRYGKECDSVVECGIRTCVSTWGFMKGLYENGKDKKLLVGLDLSDHPNVHNAMSVSKPLGIDHRFYAGDDLLFPLKSTDEGFKQEDDDVVDETDPTKRKKMFDCVFIDSLHVFQQCFLECEKFDQHCKKYMIFHDTTIDRYTGEFLRWGGEAYVMNLSRQKNWDPMLIRLGIWPAITDFVTRSKGEWILEKEYSNNNGLTILRRKDVPSLC